MKAKRAIQEQGKAGGNWRLDEKRVAELLEIATDVFVERGFEGASTNEIARRANCSKTTLYSRYPTKEKLFVAVLERRMDYLFREVFTALSAEEPIQRTLTEFGARVVRFAGSERQLRLFRVVSMEADRFPALAEHYYEIGPRRGQLELSRYFEKQIRLHRLIREDPHIMAEHFLSLLTGGSVRWRILTLRQAPGDPDYQLHLEKAVSAFLRAYSLKRP